VPKIVKFCGCIHVLRAKM